MDSVVSVVLPAYNGHLYIKDAIESILSQSFHDFELNVLNDGSVDSTESVVQSIHDSRLKYDHQENKGLPAALNRLINSSCGKYIARQDQDDVSFSERLKKQVSYLESNPNVAMVGTWAEIWEGDVKSDRVLKHPAHDASIKLSLLFDNPFVHSSVMIRRSVLEEVGGYCEDKSRQPPEDYELWSRIARKYKLANIPEVLMAYREVPGSMSRTGDNPFLSRVIKISAENIAWYSGYPENSPEVIAVSKLSHGVYAGIPANVSFSQIKTVLRKATVSIANGANVSINDLDDLVNARLRILRYHYFEYRSGGWLGKLFGGWFGRIVKGIMRKILVMIER